MRLVKAVLYTIIIKLFQLQLISTQSTDMMLLGVATDSTIKIFHDGTNKWSVTKSPAGTFFSSTVKTTTDTVLHTYDISPNVLNILSITKTTTSISATFDSFCIFPLIVLLVNGTPVNSSNSKTDYVFKGNVLGVKELNDLDDKGFKQYNGIESSPNDQAALKSQSIAVPGGKHDSLDLYIFCFKYDDSKAGGKAQIRLTYPSSDDDSSGVKSTYTVDMEKQKELANKSLEYDSQGIVQPKESITLDFVNLRGFTTVSDSPYNSDNLTISFKISGSGKLKEEITGDWTQQTATMYRKYPMKTLELTMTNTRSSGDAIVSFTVITTDIGDDVHVWYVSCIILLILFLSR